MGSAPPVAAGNGTTVNKKRKYKSYDIALQSSSDGTFLWIKLFDSLNYLTSSMDACSFKSIFSFFRNPSVIE